MLETLGYIFAFMMGGVLGAIGGGGSILTVPIMVYFFSMPPVTATTYSLLVVGFTALIGAWRYHKKDLIDYKTSALFAAPALIGVALSRTVIIPTLPDLISLGDKSISKDSFILFAFSILMVVVGSMVLRSAHLVHEYHKPFKRQLMLRGLGVGTLTGFVGAGGGFLIVPSLVILANLPMKQAIASSLAIISFQAIFGFSTDVAFNNFKPDIYIILPFLAVTSLGMFTGISINNKLNDSGLKKAFATVTLILGLFIMVEELYTIFKG